MSLKNKMRLIAAATPQKELNSLKKVADETTAEHEKQKKIADSHAHAYAAKLGHKPSSDKNAHQQYEQTKDHYHQHVLYNEHPELHSKLQELQHRAPQARLAYKRALRS